MGKKLSEHTAILTTENWEKKNKTKPELFETGL